ncbi:MAG TPA: DUF4215 domain-containing protein [Kofleriaceae bacterium]|nr:DUF4215 domain-containing protein [Kofleriaceae bacterium]
MHAKRFFLGIVTLALTTSVGTATAVRQPEYLAGKRSVQLRNSASGPARQARLVSWTAPKTMHAAWSGFVLSEGVAWHAMWDRATDVPVRLYGGSIAAPGSIKNASTAARVARGVLSRHLDLLAPGASLADFVQTKNELDALGNRSVVFAQRYRGYDVIDGLVSFRFQKDHLYMITSTALPYVALPSNARSARIDRTDAEIRSMNWIHADFGAEVRSTAVNGPMVLPIVRGPGVPIEYHLVYMTRVDAHGPRGLWDTYVDAASGEAVAREQRLMFASGQIKFHVPERWQGTGYFNVGAAQLFTSVDGSNQTADDTGHVSWSSGSADVDFGVDGKRVHIVNTAGQETSFSDTISDGSTVLWDESDTEFLDAQLSAYIHVNIAKLFALNLNPGLPILNESLTVNVNIDDLCNAFFDPQNGTLNFFREKTAQLQGGGTVTCNNTARIADVGYHELGHYLHAASLVDGLFESAMSEGVGDYLAATITNDHGMGRGFFLAGQGDPNQPLRDIDPAGVEKVYPDDFVGAEAHDAGQVFGGTMWDLRQALSDELGAEEGVALADRLWYASLQHAQGTTTVYPEVLAADDNDGNIDNGTPHKCTIDQVFALHGLAEGGGAPGTIGIGTPVLDGLKLSFDVIEPSGVCEVAGVTSAKITWKVRGDASQSGNVDMTVEGSTYTGSLPRPAAGSVLQYQVQVTFENGATSTFPANPADPFYELFVGDVHVLYCTDFESDPTAEGWVSGATAGTDDWEWGTPAGLGGDPNSAYSGSSVFGNDLTTDGTYAPDSSTVVASPVIDTAGYQVVRLQYRRWLNVEDSGCDQATIYANDQVAWQNASIGCTQENPDSVQHEDREWRFQDVDLSSFVAGGDKVQVKFELTSDPGVQFGGWTLDDFCVVGFSLDEQGPVCGDGTTEAPETCDDGNNDDGDGCSATCTTEGSGGDTDGGPGTGGDGGGNPATGDDATGGCGCQVGHAHTGTGTTAALLLACATLGLAITRRRRARN